VPGGGSRGCALIFFLLGQGNGQGRGCQGFYLFFISEWPGKGVPGVFFSFISEWPGKGVPGVFFWEAVKSS
jgi:hypothetical protein